MSQNTEIAFTLNGNTHALAAPPMKRLLDLLREDLRLTGAKEGCGEGECGSCSVLMNGDLVNSCLVPALQANGATIITIEGLAIGETLHPIQQCFLEEGGAQCGICTPGMILATHHLLAKHPTPTLPQIQEGLAGNLCRCTGYSRIFAAVQSCASKNAAHGGLPCTSTSSETSLSPSVFSPS
ncbi:(2Fe-2S)-binding protein [Granulicella arctica]|uniref:(2Fe-2S)-binding protein n=1 Tax=Granulicella arctica TaxID=940613 RepID=UPI00295A7460|nr:(2Fe-2S)-binding protein [Granulicella arctica]